MRNKIQILLVALATLFHGWPAYADPSPEIRHLMDEPVSMLDWGIQSLRDWVESDVREKAPGLGLRGGDLVVAGIYNWKSNQIEITVTALYGKHPSPKDSCRSIVAAVRKSLVVESGDKRIYPWTSLFQHGGYESGKDVDAAIAEKLPGIVKISALVFGKPAASCTGSLLETPIYFQE